MGNYKGSKALTGTFRIVQADLTKLTSVGLVRVAVPGKTVKKAGVAKSVPYVSANGSALKKSDMTCTYYTNADMLPANEMSKSNPANPGDTIYVRITGKGNYTGEVIASYKVEEADASKDLSKAKVYAADGGKLQKQEYTGEEVSPEITVKIGSATVPKEAYRVTYIGNVNKGKATIVVTATDEGGYAGGKTATFSITAKNLKQMHFQTTK